MTAVDEVGAFLIEAGLAAPGDALRLEPLTGGVSSDIWRVEVGARILCVKRALPQLRVARDWAVPITRSSAESAWLRRVAALLPDAVPAVEAEDAARGMIAMQYLPPEDYPVWKSLLRDGVISLDVALAVGSALGTIHAATAADPACAAAFANDELFALLRLQPYLLDTAAQHPAQAPRLRALAARTAATKLALVHGDVSPKNILVGPHGPVFLDAECAWFGDPAFDLAFVLNHLLLKCVWRPSYAPRYVAALRALVAAYLPRVTWEAPATLVARCATLLPALALARVDGTSPVEYLGPTERAAVRAVATALLAREDRIQLNAIVDAWAADAVVMQA